MGERILNREERREHERVDPDAVVKRVTAAANKVIADAYELTAAIDEAKRLYEEGELHDDK